MKRYLSLALLTLAAVAGCTYDQIMATGSVVQPLINAAISSSASYYGLPEGSAAVLNAASASLWGAAAKKWGKQPVALGTVAPSVGVAIQGALDQKFSTVSGNQQAVLLQQAAAQVDLKK